MPCPTCPGGDSWNCAVCAGYLNPGPDELGLNWVPQTEIMKARSETVVVQELDDLADEYVRFFESCELGDDQQLISLLAIGIIDVNRTDEVIFTHLITIKQNLHISLIERIHWIALCRTRRSHSLHGTLTF